MPRELVEGAGLVDRLTVLLPSSYKGLLIHQPVRVLTDLAVAVADVAVETSCIQRGLTVRRSSAPWLL